MLPIPGQRRLSHDVPRPLAREPLAPALAEGEAAASAAAVILAVA